MKLVACFCGLALLFASSARAQVNQQNSLLLASSDPGMAAAASPAASAPFGSLPASEAIAAAAPAASAESAQGGGYGGSPTYNWQVYVGYTFVRLYLLPKIPKLVPNGLTVDTNGINASGVYYFPSITWVGVEGDAVGTFGSFKCSKFALAGGGARVRWRGPHGLELWGHGTLDASHIVPQTAFGGQTSFAYQFGGGADVFTSFHNIGMRVEGDLVGTHFFHTYQRSVQISAGIVYRF